MLGDEYGTASNIKVHPACMSLVKIFRSKGTTRRDPIRSPQIHARRFCVFDGLFSQYDARILSLSARKAIAAYPRRPAAVAREPSLGALGYYVDTTAP
jgi:hypothetical protein